MIVYNVQRRWFVLKEEADKYRVGLGLRPAATLKVEVDGRDDLAALLNALCEPVIAGTGTAAPGAQVIGDQMRMNELVDRAYVQTGRDIPDCIPDFLLKAHGITR